MKIEQVAKQYINNVKNEKGYIPEPIGVITFILGGVATLIVVIWLYHNGILPPL